MTGKTLRHYCTANYSATTNSGVRWHAKGRGFERIPRPFHSNWHSN